MNHHANYPTEQNSGYPAGGPPDQQYHPNGPAGQSYAHNGPAGTASTAPGAPATQQRNSGMKHTLVGLHGAGDALRGSVGAAVDSALGHHESAARNRDVMERGIAEMRDGAWRGGAHAPVNAQEQQQMENGRVRRHGRSEQQRPANNRRRSTSSSCSSCDERKQGKPRVIHNSHFMNKLDPRVRPSDRQAWADGVPTEEIRARDRKDRIQAGHAGESVGAAGAGHIGEPGYNGGNAGRFDEPGYNTGNRATGHVDEPGYSHGAGGVAANGASRVELTEHGYPVSAKQLSTEKHDHGNRLMNKLDPRVDADTGKLGGNTASGLTDPAPSNVRYNGTPSNAGAGPGYNQTPVDGHHGGASGYGAGYGSQGAPGHQQSYAGEPMSHGAAGRHDDRVLQEQPIHGSKMMNKLDPRVDSKAIPPAAGQHYAENTHPQQSFDNPHSSNYGPHSTNAGNMVDPHVDSHPRSYDNPHSSNYGPHSTNVGNRVDPNVDVDPYNQTRY